MSLFPSIRNPLVPGEGYGPRCPFCQSFVAPDHKRCDACFAVKTTRGATVSGVLHFVAYITLCLGYLLAFMSVWVSFGWGVVLPMVSRSPNFTRLLLALALFLAIPVVAGAIGWVLWSLVVKPMFWYPIFQPVWTTGRAAAPVDDPVGRLRRQLQKSTAVGPSENTPNAGQTPGANACTETNEGDIK